MFFLGLKSGTHIVFIQTPHVLMFGVSECDNTHVAMNTTMSAFAHLFLQRVSAMMVFRVQQLLVAMKTLTSFHL